MIKKILIFFVLIVASNSLVYAQESSSNSYICTVNGCNEVKQNNSNENFSRSALGNENLNNNVVFSGGQPCGVMCPTPDAKRLQSAFESSATKPHQKQMILKILEQNTNNGSTDWTSAANYYFSWRAGDEGVVYNPPQISQSYNNSSYINAPRAYPCAENGSCYGDISAATGRPKTIEVQGYYRKDGTYVRGHYRSKGK